VKIGTFYELQLPWPWGERSEYLPVVSTALPSVAMYVPGDEAILIDRNDPDALTEAVLRLRHDPDQRDRRAQRACNRAESLAWPRIAPRFDQLYRQPLA
jgi:glycosyltransferase involved in cell wall biosynthesis